MDNVTHSLVGVLIGRAFAGRAGSLRGPVWAAVLGSNLPDLDILGAPFYEDGGLGYLVHHRGFTHTFVATPLLGVAAGLLAARLDRDAKRGPLLLAGVVGAVLHVVADGWNHYGVHPWWPLDGRWVYGDSVFIAEPWLWAVMLPAAFGLAGGGAARVGLGLVALLGLAGTAWAAGPGLAVWAALVGVALHRLGQREGPATLLRASGVAAAAVVAIFHVGGALARQRAAEEVAFRAPVMAVFDLASTPAPGRPWCWQVLASGLEAGQYRVEEVQLSLLPAYESAGECRLAFEGPGPGEEGAFAARTLFYEPADDLVAAARSRCRVEAFLRWSRVPAWEDEGGVLHLRDLRYAPSTAPEGARDWARIDAAPGDERGCDPVAPWVTPWADIESARVETRLADPLIGL